MWKARVQPEATHELLLNNFSILFYQKLYSREMPASAA